MRAGKHLIVVAMALAPMAAHGAAPPPAAPVYREIRDWIVACDNARACFAKAKGGDAQTGYLSIAREAGASGKLTVSIVYTDIELPRAPNPKTLLLDGKALSNYAWTATPKENATRLSGADALRFVRDIRDADELLYWGKSDPPPYPGAKDSPRISLAGLAAVLLVVDEDQGRLDNETAFVRQGSGAASAVPRAPELPVVHATVAPKPLANGKGFAAGVRQVMTSYLKNRCQPDMAQADEAYALHASEMIALLGCNRGAYQGSYFVFRAPLGRPDLARQVALPLPPTVNAKDYPPDREYVGDVNWNPKTATLSESTRGRGPGDCGTNAQWTYDGTDFQVTEFRRQDFCGGPPGDFPTVYRARVTR